MAEDISIHNLWPKSHYFVTPTPKKISKYNPTSCLEGEKNQVWVSDDSLSYVLQSHEQVFAPVQK